MVNRATLQEVLASIDMKGVTVDELYAARLLDQLKREAEENDCLLVDYIEMLQEDEEQSGLLATPSTWSEVDELMIQWVD